MRTNKTHEKYFNLFYTNKGNHPHSSFIYNIGKEAYAMYTYSCILYEITCGHFQLLVLKDRIPFKVEGIIEPRVQARAIA